MRFLLRFILSFIFFIIAFPAISGDSYEIKGVVRDSLSKETLPFSSIVYENTTTGITTDDRGRFTLKTTSEEKKRIEIRMIGYKAKTISVDPQRNTDYVIYLSPVSYELEGLVVKAGKEKYSKKNNPAVDFISEMIKNRNASDPKNQDYFSYEHYEKTTFALNDYSPENQKIFNTKRFQFLSNYVDTSLISGKPILNVAFKEVLEDVYFRKSPASEKQYIKAIKQDGIDEILPQGSIKILLDEVFRDVNIFDNDILLLTNHFVSPLSTIGTSYYKYYLNDTIVVNGDSCVSIQFIPFNSESFGFTGTLLVTLDSTKFVKHARLIVPSEINLNFVKDMIIEQDFDRMPDGSRILLKDDMIVNFRVTSNSQELYVRRTNTFRHQSFDPPEDMSIFQTSEPVLEARDSHSKNDAFWKENRHEATRGKEDSVQYLMKDFRSVPIYYYTEKILTALFSGYVPIKSKNSPFDIGPINTMISANDLEGLRLRAGGATTAYLDRHLFGSGFVAYGFKDEKLKYRGQLEYSFPEKKEYPNEFPIHSLKASYEYDINELGQHYLYTNRDNLFMSLKMKNDTRSTYQRNAELEYKQEMFSGFSYDVCLRNSREYMTQYVPFIKRDAEGNMTTVDSYSMTDMEFSIRYAPHEKFFQTRQNRFPINRDYPIFTLTHIVGQKGILGSDYNLNRTEFSYHHRYWIWIAGFMDVVFRAGKIWDKVPFPMLTIPNTNLSYIIQEESYNLMDPMEFVNDQYLSWDVTYYLNGFLFNRIPLVKKLKWREVVAFRGLYGSLSDRNNPENNHDLYLFPEKTYIMGKEPYMELGVGLDNVLKILRIDYVWRLTYKDHPDVFKRGIRVRLHVNF